MSIKTLSKHFPYGNLNLPQAPLLLQGPSFSQHQEEPLQKVDSYAVSLQGHHHYHHCQHPLLGCTSHVLSATIKKN